MVQREDFFERVWELVAEIPYGRGATYGSWQICWAIPGTPDWPVPPCTTRPRACPATGSSPQTGAAAPHWPEQQMLLLQEGVSFLPGGKADLAHYRWEGL